MERVYLVKKDPSKENAPDNWNMMGRNEFREFINTPEGRRRAQDFGRLDSCGQNDCIIYVECGETMANELKREHNRGFYLRQIEKAEAPYGNCSLSTPVEDDLTLEDLIADPKAKVEEAVLSRISNDEIKKGLLALDPMERSLIQFTVLDENPMTLSEFACCFHLDRTYLHRKKESAFKKLRVFVRRQEKNE